MAPNNLCSTLIVYGSFIPGGKNHHLVAHLPGIWRPGKIRAQLIDPPDGIGPGEVDEVEAWTIDFADCQSEMFTEAWKRQERLLHDRWTSLDAQMGEDWVRTSMRWWPAGAGSGVSRDGMIVVNIYVPRNHFPHRAKPNDVPAPDEADDIGSLWQKHKSGEKRYESDLFTALIKDTHFDEIDRRFADLPGAGHFVDKLRIFFADHQFANGSVLRANNEDSSDEAFYLYVAPLQRNIQPKERLVDLARQQIALFCNLLIADAQEDSLQAAITLERLTFEIGEPLTGDSSPNWNEPAACALETVGDLCRSLIECDEPWFDAISEASYGIAASFELQPWLVSGWYRGQPDFSPLYEFWKAGGACRFDGEKCVVFDINRRPG